MSAAPRIRRFQADFKAALVDRLREGVTKDLGVLGAEPALVFSLVTVMDELCCNVLEHSQASWVELESAAEEGGISLVLRDDGISFDPSRGLVDVLDIEQVKDRHLGLYMVGKMTDGFKYARLPEGINETRVFVKLAPQAQ